MKKANAAVSPRKNMFLLIQKSVEQHHLSLVSDYLTISGVNAIIMVHHPKLGTCSESVSRTKTKILVSLARFGLASNIFADSYIHPFGDV